MSQAELETCACPLGCSPDDRFVVRGWDRLHGQPGVFSVVECRGCGLMRTNPRPTPEGIVAYYPPEYGPHQTTRVRPVRPGSGWLTSIDRLLTWQLRGLAEAGAHSVPPLPPGRMLEIGCGAGSFLHEMAGRGWQPAGIELSAAAAAEAANLGYVVVGRAFQAAPPPAEPFDLVVGWMVFEHLHDPVDAFRTLHAWTHRESWLALSVPNAGSFQLRLFGRAWFALHLPNHLFHFTPRTLQRALHAGGWTMCRVIHQPNISDVVASVGYFLHDHGMPRAVADPLISYPWWGGRSNAALIPLAWPLSMVGQTSRMTVWARRRND